MKTFHLTQAWAGPHGWRTRRTAPNRKGAEQNAADLCDRDEYGANAYRPEDVRIVEVEAETVAEAIELGNRGYSTELTPEGQQFVIPGCEHRPAPGSTAPAQLSLF